jgi:hypothetical protein
MEYQLRLPARKRITLQRAAACLRNIAFKATLSRIELMIRITTVL